MSGPQGISNQDPPTFEFTLSTGSSGGVKFECRLAGSNGEVGAPGTMDWAVSRAASTEREALVSCFAPALRRACPLGLLLSGWAPPLLPPGTCADATRPPPPRSPQACSSPQSYKGLPDGAYQFSVRAQGEKVATSSAFVKVCCGASRWALGRLPRARQQAAALHVRRLPRMPGGRAVLQGVALG